MWYWSCPLPNTAITDRFACALGRTIPKDFGLHPGTCYQIESAVACLQQLQSPSRSMSLAPTMQEAETRSAQHGPVSSAANFFCLGCTPRRYTQRRHLPRCGLSSAGLAVRVPRIATPAYADVVDGGEATEATAEGGASVSTAHSFCRDCGRLMLGQPADTTWIQHEQPAAATNHPGSLRVTGAAVACGGRTLSAHCRPVAMRVLMQLREFLKMFTRTCPAPSTPRSWLPLL